MRCSFFQTGIICGMLLCLSCSNGYQQGKMLYNQYCAACHMDNGAGLAALYPPLSDSDYLRENQDKIPCIIRNGLSGNIVVNNISYDIPMEGIKELTDVEIHNIIRYINQAWNNDIEIPSFKATEDRLKSCVSESN